MLKRAALIVISASLLSGCAATQVAISKRNLDVQTKMSSTVFLDPVAADKRTVFVQLRNTSDKPDLAVEQELTAAIAAKGYRLVADPDLAHYVLQANILQVGKTSPTATEAVIQQGYGASAAGGLVLGAGAAYAGGSGGRGIAAAGLVGALAEGIAGAAVKDVYYSLVTDLQIKERIRGSRTATVNSNHQLKQGTSGSSTVTYSEESQYKTYQTRIASTANKVNLEFDEALPELKKGLITSVAGLF
ncbi:MAG: complement resistance protein TraT [Thauera sp.]|nr:complement resistance protein TraT [Thauera sp.]